MSIKASNLRRVAEGILNETFHDLSSDSRDELATSLVRQWITNEGVAVIVTRDHCIWYHLKPNEDGSGQVVREVTPGTFTDHMRRSRVVEEQIPQLLHEVTLRQRARCTTDDGEVLELRVEPATKTFHIELVPDDER